MFLSLAGGVFASAQAAVNAVRLPVTGTFAGGGQFAGTVTINRFAVDANGSDIIAIGFVSGVLTRGNKTIGTAVTGEVTWSVTLRSSGAVAVSSPGSALRIVPTQKSCPALDLALGPEDVNLLGFQVALSAVTFNISGETGTPVGDLVCAIEALLGRVADVVNLLNSLLGLLTGLLGGIIPAA
jgi:hypothetical protein